jgi:hypothetical protein
MRKRVLIVGETSEPDFRHLVAWLSSRCDLNFAKALPQDFSAADEIPPDVIVFLQAWPGQFRAACVERLHRRWPLARLFMVLSSWCEGETRSGKPCPGVWRVYWYDFVRRLGPIFESMGMTKSWTLPRSAGDVERLVCDLTVDPQPQPGTVMISAYSTDAYEALADACRALHFDVMRYPSSPFEGATPITTGVWDARRGDELEWSQISDFARSLKPASVTVIQSFPRLGDQERASNEGLSILAKPFQLPDLWRALNLNGTINHETHRKMSC